MKKLALLLLALPLAACAIPTPEQRAQLKATQLAHAETTCSNRGVGPADSNYLRCLNGFTRINYGMVVKPLDDGSLTLVNAAAALPGGPNDSDVGLAEYGSPNGPPN